MYVLRDPDYPDDSVKIFYQAERGGGGHVVVQVARQVGNVTHLFSKSTPISEFVRLVKSDSEKSDS